jgi:hypothetical protein
VSDARAPLYAKLTRDLKGARESGRRHCEQSSDTAQLVISCYVHCRHLITSYISCSSSLELIIVMSIPTNSRPQTGHQHLYILLIIMADKVHTRISIIRNIRLLDLPSLQATALSNPTSNRSLQSVLAALDREVGQGDLVRIASDNGRQTEERGIDLVVGDLQLEVSTVVEVVPVEFGIGALKPITVVVRGDLGDILAVRARRADG